MKNKIKNILLLLFASISLTSCAVIEGIFKAGFGIGIFVTIAIIVLIIYIISKFSKK
ncbi:hypothetical protein [Flavobacterium sp.]|uniref:hypothetical protein n=1 Tax=Flavobacterium sp. TaxID=239 RepID=UPI002630DEA7|nr:hypothetical protein [Flavobacterium sp.]MDD2987001.1 hypothetical protein [Flavobacterium sp.]